MAELWIGNVAPDATDTEIRELLVRYGFPAFDEIQHLPGDGSRPAVLLNFHDTLPQALYNLQGRIQHLYWKERKLQVQVMASERH